MTAIKELTLKNESRGPLELKRKTVGTKDFLLLKWLWKFKMSFLEHVPICSLLV